MMTINAFQYFAIVCGITLSEGPLLWFTGCSLLNVCLVPQQYPTARCHQQRLICNANLTPENFRSHAKEKTLQKRNFRGRIRLRC